MLIDIEALSSSLRDGWALLHFGYEADSSERRTRLWSALLEHCTEHMKSVLRSHVRRWGRPQRSSADRVAVYLSWHGKQPTQLCSATSRSICSLSGQAMEYLQNILLMTLLFYEGS